MFHIHLPFGDDGIREIERVLGIKFQEVHVQLVKKNEVKVCPMSLPSSIINYDYGELSKTRHYEIHNQ